MSHKNSSLFGSERLEDYSKSKSASQKSNNDKSSSYHEHSRPANVAAYSTSPIMPPVPRNAVESYEEVQERLAKKEAMKRRFQTELQHGQDANSQPPSVPETSTSVPAAATEANGQPTQIVPSSASNQPP